VWSRQPWQMSLAAAALAVLSSCGQAAQPATPSQQPGQIRAISTNGSPTAPASAPAASAAASGLPSAIPTTSAGDSASPPARIGLVAPFSGIAAAFGQDMLKGMQMAIDESNGSGALDGKRLAIDQGDDRGDASLAAGVAKKLVADGVAAIVGPPTSGSAQELAAAVNQAKVPAITPAANDPRITDQAASGAPFMFRAAGRWDQEASVLLPEMMKSGTPPKVVLVADQSAYGQALASSARQALGSAGLQPAGEESVESGSKDFGPVIARIKTRSPSAIFYGGFAADGGNFAKQLATAGVKARLMLGDAAEDRAFVDAAGTAGEGAMLAFPPDPKQVPTAATFLEAYKRRYGVAASLYAVSTYDSARLVIDALKRAGSADGESLRQAIASTSDFNGVYWGKMSFDAKGDLQGRTYVLWTVRAGKFVQEGAS